jgi:hypothetical protein
MPRTVAHFKKPLLATAALSGLFTVMGCASNNAIDASQPLGLKCVDDSSHCVAQRKQVLNIYMTDDTHAWVKQPAGPHAYASGVRLFALSKKRKDLTCDELSHGKQEADRAPAALKGSDGAGLTPSQISRSLMLAHEVSRELGREFARRCRKS